MSIIVRLSILLSNYLICSGCFFVILDKILIFSISYIYKLLFDKFIFANFLFKNSVSKKEGLFAISFVLNYANF